tara:strand:- start:6665 stop:6772 length:108 start_codon:yes stop_codon:yes gene_type:complete
MRDFSTKLETNGKRYANFPVRSEPVEPQASEGNDR